MSRYILTPNVRENECKNRTFHLTPTEGITEQVKTIELPKELVPNNNQMNSNSKFIDLPVKLSKVNIGRNKDGFITIGNKIQDIKFDSFVADCCNNQFKEEYENIYCMLRNSGITF